MTVNTNKQSTPTLLSIRDFSIKHPFMSECAIRWMLFQDPPGLAECLVRIGARIYIIEDKYFAFLLSNKMSKKKMGDLKGKGKH